MNLTLVLEWMKKNDYRPEDVASLTGLHYNGVLKILNGKTKRPHRTTVFAFAHVMRVKPEVLQRSFMSRDPRGRKKSTKG